jgi:hypothetical protein
MRRTKIFDPELGANPPARPEGSACGTFWRTRLTGACLPWAESRRPGGCIGGNADRLQQTVTVAVISVLTVNGDKATVTVIKEGLTTPTAVEPDGGTIWIAERGAGKAVSIPMPK